MTVALATRGALGFSAQVGSFLAKSASFLKGGFTHSFTGIARELVINTSKNPDKFISMLSKGGWASFAAAGLITVPTAVMNLTNFFDDGRRMKEIASGQSNFFTDRKAASRTWGLSALGLASSTVVATSGLLMGGASITSPVGMAVTAGSGILAVGSLIARQLHKYITIDLPFKGNSGLGLLSMNRPVFRVDDPSSPYYMMSHMMEKTVKNREIQDSTNGELGSEYGKKLERMGLAVTNYLTA